jgi:hypothetical protein
MNLGVNERSYECESSLTVFAPELYSVNPATYGGEGVGDLVLSLTPSFMAGREPNPKKENR